MSKLEELQRKYGVTKEEAELLEYQMEYHSFKNDNEILDSLIQLAMLQQNMQRLGFEPSLDGCKHFADCIPEAVRSDYPESIVDTVIMYMG